MNKFNGIFTALITPFDNKGRVNLNAIYRLVSLQTEAGADGVFITGTTGEVYLLSEQERKDIISACVEASSGKLTLIANIAALTTEEAVRMADFAKNAGVHALGLLPPIYFNYNPEQIFNFYKEVCAAASLPVFAYDYPANTGIELLDESYNKIFDIFGIEGLKASHTNFNALEKFKRKYPQKTVLLGVDECFVGGLAMGFDGGIGSTFNLMTPQFQEIRKSAASGDFDRALKIQNICNDFIDVLVACGVIPSIKFLLGTEGLDCGECRKPFKKLTNDEKDLLLKGYKFFCERSACLLIENKTKKLIQNIEKTQNFGFVALRDNLC